MKTYKDIYKFPLHLAKYGSWVWDAAGNFVFQFETENKHAWQPIVDIINGKKNSVASTTYSRMADVISTVEGHEIIQIRGWGGLTGTGGHNLSHEEAANIQDTFAEYIVERLNS